MGVFRNFPYSNFHEMNMDEIIKIVKNMLEEWAQYHAEWKAWMEEINDDWSNYKEVMDEAWENMQEFINNYFDNLDVQTEINNKITAMVASGEFGTIVAPYVPPEVTSWLAQHITTPETVVIDDSLTIQGACADAKATGDAISPLKMFCVNLFPEFYPQEDDRLDGYYVKATDGQWSSAPSFSIYRGIKVTPNTTIELVNYTNNTSDTVGIAFYGDELLTQFISGVPYSTLDGLSVTVPSTAHYVSISVVNSLHDKFAYSMNMENWIAEIDETADDAYIKTKDFIPSKNLLDKTAITSERYLSSGVPTFNASFFVTDFIPVEVGKWYTTANNWNACVYNESKVYISDITLPYQATSGDGFIRFTFANTYLDTAQVEENGINTKFSSYGYKVSKDTLHFDDATEKGDNLFNKNVVSSGYLNPSTGAINTSAIYFTTPFLLIDPDEIYTVKGMWGSVCLYDATKTFVRSVASIGMNFPICTFKTGSGEVFARFTVYQNNLNIAKFEKNIGWSEFTEDVSGIIKAENISCDVYKTTHVMVGSGYYFDTINSANNAISENDNKHRFILHIASGTYNETFRTKDYVDYIGDNKHQCIINYISDNESDYLNRAAIFAETYSKIKNLTVRTTGSKYPIHADARYGFPYVVDIEDCIIKHDGFADTSIAPGGTGIGIGLHAEQYVNIKRCIVAGTSNVFGDASIYCHNDNENNTNPWSLRHRGLTVEECILKDSYYGLRMDAIETVDGQDNDVVYIGNTNTCDTPFYNDQGTYNSWHWFNLLNTPEPTL